MLTKADRDEREKRRLEDNEKKKQDEEKQKREDDDKKKEKDEDDSFVSVDLSDDTDKTLLANSTVACPSADA